MVYSRRTTIEERRNKRKAFFFFLLTLLLVLILFFYGLPAIAKFSAFLVDINKSSQPVEMVDNTPPPPPMFETLPSYTNDNDLELKGRTEAGSSVKIFINGKSKEILTNNEGVFTLNVNLNNGKNTISAIASDSAGNESQKTKNVIITFDDEEPTIEITKPVDGSSFFGPKQRQIVIEGVTEENSRLNINNRWVVVESSGKFSYATTLNEGENKFTISAEDEAGNSIEKNISVTYTP